MKRPDVFSALYLMSSCCLTANRAPRPDASRPRGDHHREQAETAASAPGFGRHQPRLGGGVVASPSNPPLYLDLPVKDGKVRPDVVAKWVANAPIEMVGEHLAALNRYYAIAIDIGLQDGLLGSNQQLHEALSRLHVPHSFEEYEGDHTNQVRERIERNVLPFFAKNLASPVSPTSPTPQP